MEENYPESIYGTNYSLVLCPKCGHPDLIINSMKTTIDNIGNSTNWFCKPCKILWVKGLKNPRYTITS